MEHNSILKIIDNIDILKNNNNYNHEDITVLLNEIDDLKINIKLIEKNTEEKLLNNIAILEQNIKDNHSKCYCKQLWENQQELNKKIDMLYEDINT